VATLLISRTFGKGAVAAGVAVEASVENPVEPLAVRHAVAQAKPRVELVVDVQLARLRAVEMAREAVDVQAELAGVCQGRKYQYCYQPAFTQGARSR